MFGKEEVRRFLDEHHIPYEWMDHAAVYNMEEMAAVHLPHPEAEAKNLFVRDDKKQHYYLITVHGDKRIDLKKFQRENGTRRLSFAGNEDLMNILGLIPGAVSPLGLLNDTEHRTDFYLDQDFLNGERLIGVHPNDNTATVWLSADNLLRIIQEQGISATIVSFDDHSA